MSLLIFCFIPAGIGARHQVFRHRQVLENPSSLHDLKNTHFDNIFGIPVVDLPPHEFDGAVRHLPFLRLQQPGYRLQGCGLAGAVRAQKNGDLSFLRLHGHPLEDKDDIIVNHTDVVELQHITLSEWLIKWSRPQACSRKTI